VELESVRFLLVPANSGAFRLEAANPQARISRIHLQRMPIGSQYLWVELVAVDRQTAGRLKVPTGGLAAQLRALNSNLSIQFASRYDVTEMDLVSVH
jgi:hypothetical protein